MSNRIQSQLVFHGAIVLFVGLLAGLVLVAAEVGNWSTAHAWSVTHTSLVTGGTTFIVVGLALPRLLLGERSLSLLVRSVIASAYGFTFALLVGPAFGLRGFHPTGSALGWLVFVATLIGVAGVLLGIGLMIRGAYAAMRVRT